MKMINKEILALLNEVLLELKPEFQDVNFIYDNKLEIKDGKIVFAHCFNYLKPPVISFQLGSIKKVMKKPNKGFIKELVAHEIIHYLGIYQEGTAYGHQGKVKIFKDSSDM